MTRRDIPPWLPLTLLVLAMLALFHRLLSGQTLFWGLPSLQFYPWREFAFDQLSMGRLPAWNPYVGAGAPLLANYQTALFYPPNWLLLLLPDPQAMNLIALLHIFWAGLGMWLFTGALGLPYFGRGVSTLSYALSGYLIGRVGSFPTADAGAWMPWIFWLTHLIITQRQWRNIGWLGLAFGMQLLSGHAQTTWYSSLGVAFYALWQLFWRLRTQPRKERMASLVILGIAVILGLAIAAIQLIPTAEYFGESQRSGGLDYGFTTNLSYAPGRLITLLSPNFYGTPADGTYLTQGIYFEDAAYIGFLPLISAVAAIAGRIRKRRFLKHYPIFSTVSFWVVSGFAALLIAMGKHGPVFPFLYKYVPTFDLFRDPVRWLLLTVFSLSVLAGIGTQHWGRGKWVVFWSRLAAAGGGAMAMMALGFRQFMQQDSKNLEVLTMGIVVLGCWVAVCALLTLIKPDNDSRLTLILWRSSVLAFVTIDLAWAAAGLNPTVPNDFYRSFGVSRPQGRIYWFVDYEREVKYDRFFDLADYRRARDQWPDVRASLLPNINMLDNVSALNNNDPLLPDYHRRYVALIESLRGDAGHLLQAAGVSEVYGLTRPDGWEGEAPLFVSPDETPLAWLVSEAVWGESDEAIQEMLRDPAWNPRETVIIAGTHPADTAPRGTVTNGDVILVENLPNRVRYRVRTDDTAYLVISNTWYPGWTATVDGEKATLYRANLAFQAVAIPPGGADVVLRYNLNHWQIGAGITLLAVFVAFGIIAFGSLSLSREQLQSTETAKVTGHLFYRR